MSFAARALGAGGTINVSITAGSSASSHVATSHTFTSNLALATGGTGVYSYQWHESDDGNTWTSPGTAQIQAVVVQGVVLQTSAGHYYCVVTDSGGAVGTSSVSTYAFTNF